MSFRSIGENVSELKRDFAYEEGYFWKKGKSSTNSRVRNIESSDPKTTAKIFYDKIAFGGKESNIYNRSGEIVGKKQNCLMGVLFLGEKYHHLTVRRLWK